MQRCALSNAQNLYHYPEGNPINAYSFLSKFLIITILFSRYALSDLKCSNDPGYHKKGESPLLGTKRWEVQKIENSPFRSLFDEFGTVLYENTTFRSVIPSSDLLKCEKYADKIFKKFIGEFESYNCTSDNIIFTESKESIGYVRLVGVDSYRATASRFDDEFSAPLLRIHELRHVQEAPFSSAKGISELFTSLQQHILSDLAYRRCFKIRENEQVDYKKSLSFEGKVFPADELALVYSQLEKSEKSLSSALLSSASISYLIGNPEIKFFLDLALRKTGSQKVIREGLLYLEDPNRHVRLAGIFLAQKLIQIGKYAHAFKLLVPALRNSDENVRKAAIRQVRSFIDKFRYDLAWDFIKLGLEAPDENVQKAAIEEVRFFIDMAEYDLASDFIKVGLQHTNENVRKAAIEHVGSFIHKAQYVLASGFITKGLEDLNENVQKAAIEHVRSFIRAAQYDLAFRLIELGLEDPNENVRKAAIEHVRFFILKAQYDLAFRLIELGLQNSDENVRKAAIEPVSSFIRAAQYDLAFRLIELGLEDLNENVRKAAIEEVSSFIHAAQYDLALGFIKQGLEDPNENVRKAAIEEVSSFIHAAQYDLADDLSFRLIEWSLQNSDENVRQAAMKQLKSLTVKEQHGLVSGIETMSLGLTALSLISKVRQMFGRFSLR